MAVAIKGTPGNDTLVGTSGDDVFNLRQGGNDHASGLGGADVFEMGAAFNAADRIGGGGGNDRLILDGDYSAGVTLGAHTITSVNVIQLTAGHDYNLTTNDGNLSAGQTLTILGNSLGIDDGLTFDGSAETNGSFHIYTGAGNDTVTGGSGADLFQLRPGGHDVANGGAGNDVFRVDSNLLQDSINGGSGNDTLWAGFAPGPDLIFLNGGNLSSIETLDLLDGGYKLHMDDNIVAAGATMTVDTRHSTGGISFIGGDEMDGHFHFIAGHGDYSFDGSNQSDLITFRSNFDSGDQISGLGGSDTLELDGDYSALSLDAAQVNGVETVKFDAGHSYTGVTVTGDIAGATTLTLDASRLGAAHSFAADLTGAASAGYIVKGGHGDDSVTFGTNFVFATFHAGAGNDTLALSGDYSGGYTFGANQISSVETLKLDGGNSYDLATVDGNVAAGATLTVDATGLNGATDTLTFDGSAENDGTFIVDMGGNLVAADSIRGGAGNDTVIMSGMGADGNDTLILNADTLVSVETLKLGASDYDIVTNDGNVANGATLTVDATALTTGHTLIFDGSAETNGSFVFDMGASYTSSDQITGGSGNDTLELNGDYGSLTLADTSVQKVGLIQLDDGHNYNIALNGDLNSATHVAEIDGTNVSASYSITADFSAATSTYAGLIGGAGDDTATYAGNYRASDTYVGGGGNDTLVLNGDYSAGHALTLAANNLFEVGNMVLDSGHSYDITTDDANVDSGATLTVDASALGASDTLKFNGSAETDGHFDILGGAGNDTLTGGSGGDTFDGGAGADNITAGTGADTFSYGSVSDSNINGFDTINGTNFADDIFKLDVQVDALGSPPVVGPYTGGGTLTLLDVLSTYVAHDYFQNGQVNVALVNVSSVTDAPSDNYLIVDANHDGLFDASDYVFRIHGYSGSLSVADFTT